jgi:cyclopropane-fatty-acyl-phospholipid synthase
MRTVDLEDITAHYAETIRRWRDAFADSATQAGELGYDVRFRRTWELYLAYVEAGFRECRIADIQMLLAKPEWRGRLPLRSKLAPWVAAENTVRDAIEEEAGTA